MSDWRRRAPAGDDWQGARMRPEEWEDEEEPGCWNGISGWALTSELFMLEYENMLCCFYTPSVLRLPQTPSPSQTERKGSFIDARVDWALQSLLMFLFFCWGDCRQIGGRLDVVPRTTSKEAAVCTRRQDQSRNQRWLTKKVKQFIKGRHPMSLELVSVFK